MSRDHVSNSDDIIDSRDVIERIKSVETREGLADFDEADADELAALRALATEAEGCSDWEHGAQLIRDSYFEDYARELAEDIGAISDDAQWPCRCIDWEKAARELRMDYTAIEFDGVTYWIRS